MKKKMVFKLMILPIILLCIMSLSSSQTLQFDINGNNRAYLKPIEIPNVSNYRESQYIQSSDCEIAYNYYNPSRAAKINLFVENVTCINDFGAGTYNTGQNITLNDLLTHSFSVVDVALNNFTYITGILQNQTLNGSWIAEFDTTHIPESKNIAVKTNFSNYLHPDNPFSIEFTEIFEISHNAFIQYLVKVDPNQENAEIIVTSASSTYNPNESDPNNAAITSDLAKSAKYIIKSKSSNNQVQEGILEYDKEIKQWSAEISLKDFPNGEYYVMLVFDVNGFLNTITVGDTASDKNCFTIAPSRLMIYIYIIVGVSILILGVIGLYVRKAKKNIERKPEKKAGPIEIVEISKSELKKTRLTAPPKKKATAVNKTGLIFNVPTWEVEEEESSDIMTDTNSAAAVGGSGAFSKSPSAAPAAATAAAAAPVSYTLHCPGCNSWYEIDFFEKMECPKCNTNLDVAMYCKKCTKWFDVAEPADINCPLCSSKLGFSK